MVTTSASQHKSPKEPKMIEGMCVKCSEWGPRTSISVGNTTFSLCLSCLRSFYCYVADRLEAAERADEEAERASR